WPFREQACPPRDTVQARPAPPWPVLGPRARPGTRREGCQRGTSKPDSSAKRERHDCSPAQDGPGEGRRCSFTQCSGAEQLRREGRRTSFYAAGEGWERGRVSFHNPLLGRWVARLAAVGIRPGDLVSGPWLPGEIMARFFAPA